MNAYEFLGREEGIEALVTRFYEHMDTLPEAAEIRAMHPAVLTGSIWKLTAFLVQRFGGPTTYSDKRGHPRLRMRHAPFAIADAEAEAWVMCMDLALDEQVAAGPEREELKQFFRMVAAHMRNRA
jgi:hemoglobin